MNFVAVPRTPLAPDRTPAWIAFRSAGPDRPGAAAPIVFLHGGWGYDMYPFDRQMAAFTVSRRVVIPHRSGYGDSPPIESLPADFHDRVVDETRAVLDALALAPPVLWGHSDGAIIALRLALHEPDRVLAVLTLVVHGARDPRTEPGEIEALREAAPQIDVRLLDAGHSPHSESSANAVTEAAARFLGA